MSDVLLAGWLLWPILGLVAALALAAPLHFLLGLDLALMFLPGQWRVGGVRVDPGDLVIAGLLLALLVRGRWQRQRLPWRLPGFALWLALGTLLCVAYLAAPGNQGYLTTPERTGYQLLRYCWKPILYYPLAALLLATPQRAWVALAAVVAGGDLCAAIAIPQGYQGLRAAGPFVSPNTLGAVLVVPILIAAAGALLLDGRWRRLACLASLLLLGRALLFSGSRGAALAVAAGGMVLLWHAMRRPRPRRRLARAAPWAVGAALAILVLHPGILQRPSLQRFMVLSHPMDEGTLQWRMKLRWPHFWHQVERHPVLGTGTYVDMRLGTSANTPHNGYLATAVESGLPALGLYLLLVVLAIGRSLGRLRLGASVAGDDGALDALVVAALVGLMVHNFDDTVWPIPAIAKVLWLLVALALAPPRSAAAAAAAAETGMAPEVAARGASAAHGGRVPAAAAVGRA